jgi:hypothetical protein
MKTKYYLNLTNGIEYLPFTYNKEYSYLRIQSTACEQKRWEFILQDLDYDLLMNLAIGNVCVIIDYSARKAIPRSIYQGVEWIKYVLSRVWLNKEYIPSVRGHDCTEYFNQQYASIRGTNTLNKIKYFRKFLACDSINIETVSNTTRFDGDYLLYKKILLTPTVK